ncbi:MAG TPA: DUF1844 domain-containing protein [Armatimonadota bacterium]|jgi:hypothetical protein
MAEDEVTPQAEETAGMMPDIHVEDLLRYTMHLFTEQAWVKLGVRMGPSKGETVTNLPEAKLAIDALAALVTLTEGRFDPHEVRDLKNMVAGLQMNFVQRKTQEG